MIPDTIHQCEVMRKGSHKFNPQDLTERKHGQITSACKFFPWLYWSGEINQALRLKYLFTIAEIFETFFCALRCKELLATSLSHKCCERTKNIFILQETITFNNNNSRTKWKIFLKIHIKKKSMEEIASIK